ncbi:hypothetical protein H4R33_000385 [Dimargaris cristalligena]|uniref:Multiple inositol polyphosphate phosphatase 1 n=1 Tax=Dimargaris cristalligena TaxID=215637 RepID=A0A4P9ZMQ5_9FUNG|nr:hypothetical protein H4R33_000385 [Dimargaris cristalligena]RKP34686.1 histidine phosphatase superfamily [Dimargaris cristalligena]|eukprot:RKP34686.1 histidine phosphatase superfamily [Dimargaris cristalligena]
MAIDSEFRRSLILGGLAFGSLSLFYFTTLVLNQGGAPVISPERPINPTEPRRLPFGTKSPYAHARAQQALTANPVGEHCQLRQIQMLFRHGTRNPNQHGAESGDELLAKLQAHWKTQPEPQGPQGDWAWLNTYQPSYPTGVSALTTQGRRDLDLLARRVFHRYANLWPQMYASTEDTPWVWRATSSDYNRTVESATIFQHRLFDLIRGATKVDPLFRDDYVFDMLRHKSDSLLDMDGKCPRYDTALASGPIASYLAEQRQLLEEHSMVDMKKRLGDILAYPDITADEVHRIYRMCSYENASPRPGHTLCSLFEGHEADLDILDYWSDLEDVLAYGYGSVGPNGVAPYAGCALFTQLMDDMRLCQDHEADHTMGRRHPHNEEGSPTPNSLDQVCPRVRFWFGHSAGIMLLNRILRLNQGDPDLTGDKPLSFIQSRLFKSSEMAPFASNFAFELYECEGTDQSPAVSHDHVHRDRVRRHGESSGSGDYYFRVLHNEEIVVPQIEGCDSNSGLCHYARFINAIGDIYQCDAKKHCKD